MQRWLKESHLLLCAALLAAVHCSAGCASGIRAGSVDSPTGGIALRMFVTDRDTSHALYIVEPAGTLRFGGGLDALRGETTWAGAMSTEEIDSLTALLAEHGWLAGPPALREIADERAVEISFASPRTSYQFKVKGGGERVDAIRDFLERIANRRFDDVLNRLPQPGQQR